MSRILCGLLFAVAFLVSASAEESEEIKKLRAEIEIILRETKTPAASIALVRDRKIEWVAGIGIADVATGRRADEHTLFRIGSVSKGLVGLAALKLQEEGKLDLNAPLVSLAPELHGKNKWEATDPVRFVHLLEHTAGWHDIPLPVLARDDLNEVSVSEGLALARSSLNSRWKPGTRYAYSNVGPAVAAAVIEKITGEPFEAYMQRTWFDALGMHDASYFGSPEIQQRLATGYRRNGGAPYLYWKMTTRPSGSINASPSDMANYVLFNVQRGEWNGARLLSEASFARLETPTSTYAALQGLHSGYGLGNYETMEEGWIYRGHGGDARGSRSQMSYLPDEGAGYAVTINAESGHALHRIERALHVHITRGRAKPAATQPAQPLPADWTRFDGWYEFVSPRFELTRAISRWDSLTRIRVKADSIELQRFAQPAVRWLHCGQGLFRRAEDPIPTLALVATPEEGLVLQESGGTYRKISTGMLRFRTSLAATSLGLLFSAIFFALVRFPLALIPRLRFRGTLRLRLFPLLAASALFGMGWLVIVSANPVWNPIYRFGALTPWSGGFYLCSLLVPLFSVAGLVEAWRLRRHPMNRFARWYCIAVCVAGMVATIYLAEAGWLGVRTWA